MHVVLQILSKTHHLGDAVEPVLIMQTMLPPYMVYGQITRIKVLPCYMANRTTTLHCTLVTLICVDSYGLMLADSIITFVQLYNNHIVAWLAKCYDAY